MIDMERLYENMAHDRKIIQTIFQVYQQDHADSIDVIHQLLTQENWQELRHVVHTLKGALSYMGEREPVAVPALERAEQLLGHQQPPAPEDIEIIESELELINRQVEQFLHEHASRPLSY
jgi:signal transduction histidine kinase